MYLELTCFYISFQTDTNDTGFLFIESEQIRLISIESQPKKSCFVVLVLAVVKVVVFRQYAASIYSFVRFVCQFRVQKNSDLQAGIWFGSVAPSPKITLLQSPMAQLSLLKKSSFLNICACPMPRTFLSLHQILFLAQTADSISGFGSVWLCPSR